MSELPSLKGVELKVLNDISSSCDWAKKPLTHMEETLIGVTIRTLMSYVVECCNDKQELQKRITWLRQEIEEFFDLKTNCGGVEEGHIQLIIDKVFNQKTMFWNSKKGEFERRRQEAKP